METTSAGVSFHLLSDAELVGLLWTEEDRLPRAIVDEFARRGDRMIAPLTEICRDEQAWKREGALFWTPVHATFMLGAIGTEKALPGLLAALRWAAREDVDWVCDALPPILGAVGRPATASLKIRLLDRKLPVPERGRVVDSLAAVAARTPIEQGEILDFFRAFVEVEQELETVRVQAAHALLRFARPGDRSLILRTAIRQEWGDGVPLFTRQDVEEAYAGRTRELGDYFRDWLEFYSPVEIERRARRWREEAEDQRWSRGVKTRAVWVAQEQAQFLSRYECSLIDLDDDARGEALWVAESMTDYLVLHERVAPWRWNGLTAFSFLMDTFARRLALGDAGRIRAVPENVLRLVRFCEVEGRVAEEDRREVEECVESEREELLAAAVDPLRRRQARSMIEGLLAHGVDPADPAAAGAWVTNGLKPQAPAKGNSIRSPAVGRHVPCPCGSGRKLKRCCGR